jgi:hypothetical protein
MVAACTWLSAPSILAQEATEGPAVGSLIVEELKRAGFEVDWNGGFEQRIRIRNIDWKRR